MRFTDRGVAALRPRPERFEVWEEGRTGFGLRVSPRGRKTWIWLYRFRGRPRRLCFGTYPELTLADARVRLAEAKKALEAGDDPGLLVAAEREVSRKAETVEELVELYLEKWARPRKRSAREDERILRRDVVPAWRGRRARNIERRDVVSLLDGIVHRGAPIAANRTLAVVRKMFNFAVSRDLLAANPCLMVSAPARENARDRVLQADELRSFWRALPEAGISLPVQLILKFMLVTAQRKSEVSRAEWREFDLRDAVWTIPAEKAKNGLVHRVPLSALALEILREAREGIGDERWVFRSPRAPGPVHDTAVDHAVKASRERLGAPGLTPHDLRRTAASHMTSLGANRLVVGKILNHAEPGVTAVYDRHGYDAEKREALELWSNRLLGVPGAAP